MLIQFIEEQKILSAKLWKEVHWKCIIKKAHIAVNHESRNFEYIEFKRKFDRRGNLKSHIDIKHRGLKNFESNAKRNLAEGAT